jgi:hypothetical protein
MPRGKPILQNLSQILSKLICEIHDFAPPLRHIIKKCTVVGSHVDASDHPHIPFMRDPVRLAGTHVQDPRGFQWYSFGTHIRWDLHILVCGTHKSIEWDSLGKTPQTLRKYKFIPAASQIALRNPLELWMNAKRTANYIKTLSSFIKNK